MHSVAPRIELVREFVKAYQSDMSRNGLPTYPPREGTPTWASAESFVAWCSDHNVDPIRFSRARHEAARYAYRIGFSRLASESFLRHFAEWADDKICRVESDRRVVATTVDDTEPDGLRCVSEAVRRTLRDNRELCVFDRIVTGWHPLSPECRECLIACECRDRLPLSTIMRREAFRGIVV